MSDPTASTDGTTDGATDPTAADPTGNPGAADPTGTPTSGGTPDAGAPAAQFSFTPQCDEPIGTRIVRCCREALTPGKMGENDRHDFYRDFISAEQETSPAAAEQLTHIRTSCAMFVRAVRHWCGGPATGPYLPGTGMFTSMGNVSFQHPAFVRNDGTATPNPGDYFYISGTQSSNDGHTGIFLGAADGGGYDTAEGGGGDGTVCQLGHRNIVGNKFDNDGRTLWGWFDCTKVGLPASDPCAGSASGPAGG